MQKIACCIVFIIWLSKTCGQTAGQEIDELLKAYANENSFNGSVLVAQKDEILLQKGYGYKNASANSFNDSNTIFQIGSITKLFTALLLAQAVTEGKVTLDTTLADLAGKKQAFADPKLNWQSW